MVNIPRTWKKCTDPEILKVYNEVYEEAERLKLLSKKPPLYLVKSTRSWGRCNYSGTDSAIALNVTFVGKAENSRHTIVHELAHSAAIGDHHGDKWKRAGNSLGKKWGIDVSRLSSAEELDMESIRVEKKTNYIVKCPKCNYEWKYQRMGKVVAYPNRYRCHNCKTALIRVK